MASWRCTGCRTVYAVGIPACPHCSSAEYEEDGVAKANAEGAATHYVAEGDRVPDDLPPGVRLVGPGAPVPESVADLDALDEVLAASEPEDAAEDGSGPESPGPSTPPPSSPGSSDPGDDDDGEDGPPDYGAYRIVDLRDLCRERGLSPTGAKAELVARLAEYDAERAP
jgi:hypothetical protein